MARETYIRELPEAIPTKNTDCLRIINLYPYLLNTEVLPEWAKECKLVVDTQDNITKHTTVASLIEFLREELK